MMNRTTMKQLLKSALLVALLSGMSLLATSAMLVSQQGDTQNGGTGDHGDNPVVGSLPCAVDPDLDLIFGGNAEAVIAPQPILGMVGGINLSDQILNADGTPYGLVNRGSGFTIMGLVNDGLITVKRADASKAFMLLQQWLPDAYIGGTISMASTVGNLSRPIANNLIDLPLLLVAAAPGPVVNAAITIEGPSGAQLPDLTVNISALGNLVTVSYTP
jgi:hypothetical protein